MTKTDEIKQHMYAMCEARSITERREHYKQAVLALQALVSERGPVDAAEIEAKGFLEGAFAAIECMNQACQHVEEPLRVVNVGAAYTVLNGVINYGHVMKTEFETRLQRRVLERSSFKGKAP